AVMIAVDEGEGPSLTVFAESDHLGGTEPGNENRPLAAADGRDRGSEFAIPFGIGKLRFDNVQGRQAGGEKMAARPAAPCADLQAALSGEEPRIGVEDGGLVLVDEADLRIAPVDVPGMIDLLPEIGPGRALFVAGDHVGKMARKI